MITPTSQAKIHLSSDLTDKAQHVFLFNDLATGSLLSIGQLCDDDCIALFSKYHLKILKNNKVIIEGRRNDNGLWDVPLHKPTTQTQHSTVDTHIPMANGIIRQNQTKKELAQYLSASLLAPANSTLLRAIRRKHLISWPGLTTQLITKHLPKSLATAKGHLDQESKNLQSTKIDEDIVPSQEPNNIKTHDILCAIFDSTELASKSYSDQTGKFPIKSSQGNQYVFVMYHYDTNTIHAVAIKSRHTENIVTAWQTTFDILKLHGEAPNIHILDNECSYYMKQAFNIAEVKYQLVPPHVHRRNAAERAIRTFKNHLITGLCLCDTNFPAKEWDRLIPQATITLNLLRSSRRNPSLSAYAATFGNFDFNATPLAPPGTRTIVHLKSKKRKSWSVHGIDAWYIGPSMDHYRCFKCYIPETGAERDADTVEFFPQQVPFPQVTNETYLRQAASDLIAILQSPKSPIPSLTYGDTATNAFVEIATILKRITPPSFPKNIPNIPNGASEPRVTPAPTPTTPNDILPISNDVSEPRVNPTIAPTVTPSTLEPRVTPNTAPTVIPTTLEPRVTPTTAPIVKPITPRPMMIAPIPNPKSLASTNYSNVLASKIMEQLRGNKLSNNERMYSKLPQRRRGVPTRHNYFTRSRINGFLAQRVVQMNQMGYQHHIANHVYHHDTGARQTIDKLLAGKDSEIWKNSLSNEFGRLAQGVGKNRPKNKYVTGTNTIFFIPRDQVPADAKVTYANLICDLRPLKSETHRVRMTAGGDKLIYDGDPSSPAVSLLNTKIFFNSVISDAHKGARFSSADIKNHYLQSPMKKFQYMRIPLKYFTDEIRQEYNIMDIADNGYVYIEIRKGMYGLKEAGILAFNYVIENLAPHGYYRVHYTPGLWKHRTRKTTFILCVDDFGIKHHSEDDLDHLLNALRTKYEISTDPSGTNYIGLTIAWQYDKEYVDISMPDYIRKALQKFLHTPPSRRQHAPHKWTEPAYGQKIQYALPPCSLPILDKKGITRIQAINGTFLYYSRAVDPCMLPAINEISSQQAQPTTETNDKVTMLMDYAHTYPTATIRYHASDMQLHIDSDAAYLVLPKARSRGAGHFYLSDKIADNHSIPTPTPNGPILTECVTLRNVMSSAAEAEVGTVHHNGKVAVPIITALNEMGHLQGPIPLKTDNLTAEGFLNKKIRQKRSKSFEMRFHWMIDRIQQGQFWVYWDKGINNWADYFTKHHPPSHHKLMRPKYLHCEKNELLCLSAQSLVQGCVSNLRPSFGRTR